MINDEKALNIFCEKYKEKYKGKKMEAGDTEVVVLNNCIMVISISNENHLCITFTPEPFYIDENLDMYEEDE